MFCTQCGAQINAGQRFCAKCGVRLTSDETVHEVNSPSSRPAEPSPGAPPAQSPTLGTTLAKIAEPQPPATPLFPNVLPLSRKKVRRVYESVRIELIVLVDPRFYETNSSEVSWKRDVPKMLLTDESIIFLDGKDLARSWKELLKRQIELVEHGEEYGRTGREMHYVQPPNHRLQGSRPVPVYFSKFWTFRQSANERLYDEFKKNPNAYTRPGSVWWVRGYRDWMWINSVDHTEGQPYLQLRLARVQTIAQLGSMGRPTWQNEAIARIFLKDSDQAKDLKYYMDNITKPDLGSPFSPRYMASLPVRRPSAFAVAMFYAVCVVIVAAMALAVLLGAGVPIWVDIPLLLGVSFAAVGLLRRWQKRVESRQKVDN